MSNALLRLGDGPGLIGGAIQGFRQASDRARRNRLLDLQEEQARARMQAAEVEAGQAAEASALAEDYSVNGNAMAGNELLAISPKRFREIHEARFARGRKDRAQGAFDRAGETHRAKLAEADREEEAWLREEIGALFAGATDEAQRLRAMGFAGSVSLRRQIVQAALGAEGVNRNEQAQLGRDRAAALQQGRQAFQAGQNAMDREAAMERAQVSASRGPSTVVTNVNDAGQGADLLGKEVDAKDIRDQQQATRKMESLLPDLERLTAALSRFRTGTGGETRLALGRAMTALGMPDSLAERVAGGDIDAGEIIQAIQSRLDPAMRVPGSGASSDRDVTLFMQSLPNLARTPEGNRKIIDRNRKILRIQRDSLNRNGFITDEAFQRIENMPSAFSDAEKAEMAGRSTFDGNVDAESRNAHGGGAIDPEIETLMNRYAD